LVLRGVVSTSYGGASHCRRHLFRTLFAVGSAVAGTLPRTASAHVYLDFAEPSSGAIDAVPARLTLAFSGRLDRGSGIRLLDAFGVEVQGVEGGIDPTDRTRLVAMVPECSPGAYTVAWVAVSAEDGHAAPGFHGLLAGGVSAPLWGAVPAALPPTEAQANATGAPGLDVTIVPVAMVDGSVSWVVQTGGLGAESVQRVALTFTPPVPELGTVQVTTSVDESGTRAATFLPTILGNWRIEAIVRRAGVADDVRQHFGWSAVGA
jgi:methionine-rich copper-binding protein CopC